MLVHDGARPLVGASDVRAGMREVRVGRGRAARSAGRRYDQGRRPAIAARRARRSIGGTLWAAQTPQFALAAELRAAHERARRDGDRGRPTMPRCSSACGIEVVVVPSTSENFKVTLPADVARARADPARARR